jgi:histidinol-phosphate aminotransferase
LLSRKVREIIKSYEPYEWEPSSTEIASKTGLPPEQILRFDLNTMPEKPVELLNELAESLRSLPVNEYPEASYSNARSALSAYTGRRPEEIIVTNGADEGIDIVTKTFVDPGDTVIITPPTYSMYRICSEIMAGYPIPVSRDKEFRIDVDRIIEVAGRGAKLIFLCNPNNPTGTATSCRDIETLAEECDSVIVVDEAYYEFHGESAIDLTSRFENLIVLRTLSKAFGLAGARVGYAIATEATIKLLNKVRPPNSISTLSVALLEIALKNLHAMRADVERIKENRATLARQLAKIKGIHVYPSEANFLLARFERPDAKTVYEQLLHRGIVARRFNETSPVANCLRFTVRRREENELLCEALREIFTTIE